MRLQMGIDHTRVFVSVVCIHLIFHIDVNGVTNSTDASIMEKLHQEWATSVPSNWQGQDPCGGWDGISCTNDRVTSLNLAYFGLQGQLPDAIGSLGKLQILDLSYNKGLTGPLPAALGNLANLTHLALISCNFNGSIPDTLGKLVNLKTLDLNGNNLSGIIPPSVGDLINLVWFDITNNQITGPLPVSNQTHSGLDMLVKAKHFHFGQNKLTGPIPSKLFNSQMHLLHVVLNDNDFYGAVPASIGELQTLNVLRLDKNALRGEIPFNISNLANVTELNLSNNKFNGSIPNMSKLISLKVLILSNNSFQQSKFPEWLTSMQNINTIVMENCSFVGEIPNATFDMPAIETLQLADNYLSGSVNISNEGASHLKLVDLRNNSISYSSTFSSNLILLLQGNPICNSSASGSVFGCKNSNSQGQHYETSLSQCNNTDCPSHLHVNPRACECQDPVLAMMLLLAPSFSYLNNKTRFQSLENSFVNTFLPIGAVYLTVLDFDIHNYLHIEVKFFPTSNSTSSNSSNISFSSLSGLLALHIYAPPPDFQPFQFYPADNSEVQSAKGLSVGDIVGIVVSAVILSIITICAIVYAIQQKRRADKAFAALKPFAIWSSKGERFPEIKGSRLFTLDEIRKITNGFSKSNEIGAGGYGMVYKGRLDKVKTVAVKRAKPDSLQGTAEFRNEIELLSRIHHKNLVGLIGFCCEEGEQMLVYEYIPYGTLGAALQGKAEFQLDWNRRVQIALDSARGLMYLHELADPPIIHRDIKADNILLDENLTAKVADFGLGKLVEADDVSVAVKGTLGYIDPEYYLTQQVTEKSDVYSFGIVMLELLTSRPPIKHRMHITSVVTDVLEKHNIIGFRQKLLDPVLRTQINSANEVESFERFLNLALKCTEHDASERPYMRVIVKELENILESLLFLNDPPSPNPNPGKHQTYISTSNSGYPSYSSIDVENSGSSSDMFFYSGDTSFTTKPILPK